MSEKRTTLAIVAEKAIPAHARWRQRGRILGDDALLFDFSQLATPSAILDLTRQLDAAQAQLSTLPAAEVAAHKMVNVEEIGRCNRCKAMVIMAAQVAGWK